MLTKGDLKQLLQQKQFTNSDKVLICMSTESNPVVVKQIVEIAMSAGLRAVKKWNVSSLLSRSDGRAIRTTDGWELTESGKKYVAGLVGPLASSPTPVVAGSLRVHLAGLTNPDTASFVEEAIKCFEYKQFRAAVVLSWVGALAVLYDHVLAKALVAFNNEATKRDAKWKTAKSADDLARMKEHDLLQVLEAISVVGKSVKHELEACLKLRNGCGHPNSLKIGENKVSAHIETLIQNVFSCF